MSKDIVRASVALQMFMLLCCVNYCVGKTSAWLSATARAVLTLYHSLFIVVCLLKPIDLVGYWDP